MHHGLGRGLFVGAHPGSWLRFVPRSRKEKGGLRLETIAEAFREGEVDRRTILPGEPAGILLVKRIKVSDNDDDVIPPWDELLTKENISIVHLWIARGANYTN